MSQPKEGYKPCYFDLLFEVWEALGRDAQENGRSRKDQLHHILIERYSELYGMNINLDGSKKSPERALTKRQPRKNGKSKTGSKG
jgi:hypothetical protein